MSRPSRQPRRSTSIAFKLCMLLAILGGAGGGLYLNWHSTASSTPAGKSGGGAGAVTESDPLAVNYRTDAPTGGGVARPWLEVFNTSKQPVALSDVTLRYYFSAAAGAAYGTNCVKAQAGCSNLVEQITALPTPAPGATHYLQLSFTAGAGTLAPGASTQEIGLQFYRLDHQALDQASDHSYDAKAVKAVAATKVTAYLKGVLVWGKQPGGPSPAPTAAPAAAAAPAGVMFDNFHYSGADDPALAAHGWTVRTDGGGPGIKDTWTTSGVTFPAAQDAQGGQTMQLQMSSDGTKQGTKQSEIQGSPDIFNGTLAARVYLADKPSSGKTGDHLNESFYAISPDNHSSKYSELDYEYMPNGGWGSSQPDLDTTSWRSSSQGDRVTRATKEHLGGWHTMLITSVNGKVTYSLDGRELFTNDGKYGPRERMGVHFSAWIIDLPFTGPRTWDMKVNWVYYQDGQALSATDVQKAVDGLYASGTNYVNTVPKS